MRLVQNCVKLKLKALRLVYARLQWENRLGAHCDLYFLEAVQVVLSNIQKHCCVTYTVLGRNSKHSTALAPLKKVNSIPGRPIQAIRLQNIWYKSDFSSLVLVKELFLFTGRFALEEHIREKQIYTINPRP